MLAPLAALCLGPAAGFESGRAAFQVKVGELVIPYRVFAVYVLPHETLSIEVTKPAIADTYRVVAPDGELASSAVSSWQWRAPASRGVTTFEVIGTNDRIRLNVVVLAPASEIVEGHLAGYRIGNYPTKLFRNDPIYAMPDGFIELDERNANLQVSPHFVVSQFPSKQSTDYPKFLVLREQMLIKLELLLERVNAIGIATDSFTIMSGYRTPYYNAAIGNVASSRHVYGGAADIYIDIAPRDDYMDDLNGDGELDFRDAQYLYRVADQLFAREEHRVLRGGLGVYRRNSAHGPFLHIDARASRTRWGLLP